MSRNPVGVCSRAGTMLKTRSKRPFGILQATVTRLFFVAMMINAEAARAAPLFPKCWWWKESWARSDAGQVEATILLRSFAKSVESSQHASLLNLSRCIGSNTNHRHEGHWHADNRAPA